MKFIIEVDDFWLDQEEELEPSLTNFIKGEVIKRIWENVKEKVEKDIILTIDKMVEKQLYRKAGKFIDDFLKEGTLNTEVYKNGTYVKTELPIEEYIKSKFTKDSGWSSPNKKIEEMAKKFGDELKQRYDLLFASQIVNKMASNGLLKDEAIKNLLEDTGKKPNRK